LSSSENTIYSDIIRLFGFKSFPIKGSTRIKLCLMNKVASFGSKKQDYFNYQNYAKG
jgi:hypothetical protein